jgi:hypothetical protein
MISFLLKLYAMNNNNNMLMTKNKYAGPILNISKKQLSKTIFKKGTETRLILGLYIPHWKQGHPLDDK